MRKWVQNSLVLALLLTPAVPATAAQAADHFYVTLDGKVLHFDVEPVQVNGRVMIPLSTITEAIGGMIVWNETTQTVIINRNSEKIGFTLGSHTAVKNGESISMEIPAQKIKGEIMVPVRFLAEELGLEVRWDSQSSTVILHDANKDQPLTIKDIAKRNMSKVVEIIIYDKNNKKLATGSGIVVSPDGKVLTNYHVVKEATKAEVLFQDQTSFFTDHLLLGDEDRDLALIQIDETDLPSVKLGNSALAEVGDTVVAIGSPVGLQNTLSTGLISGVNREPGGPDNQVFLQTNAPITHGSSGGALFNMNGEVIGVTSSGYSSMGGEVNFAIPSNDVKKFLEQTPTVKKLSELAKTKPKPKPKPTEEDADLGAILNDKYNTYKLDSGETLDLAYYADKSMDEEHENDDIDVVSKQMPFLDSMQKIDTDKTLAFLKTLLKDIHSAGAANPLVTLHARYKSDTPDPNFPLSLQDYYPRTGKYTIDQTIAWAMIDDKTGEVTYLIDPVNQLSTAKQTFKLF